MNDLEKILNSNQSYIYYVTKEFYDELEKEKPNIYVWIGDEATNTICFTGEKTYSKYLKKYLIRIADLRHAPTIIEFIDDKRVATKVYNILNNDCNNSLKLIIEALNSQPYKLTL